MMAIGVKAGGSSVLPVMHDAVEGDALMHVTVAGKGDVATATVPLSDILADCIVCHQKFRSRAPGASKLSLNTSRKQKH